MTWELPHRTVIFTDYGRLAVKVMRDTRLSPMARNVILALALKLQMGSGIVSWEELERITGATLGLLFWGPARASSRLEFSPLDQLSRFGYGEISILPSPQGFWCKLNNSMWGEGTGEDA